MQNHTLFFIPIECNVCSESEMKYIDECVQGVPYKLWQNHLETLRSQQGYQLLSTKSKRGMPEHVSVRISSFQQMFMIPHNSSLRKQWVTVESVNSYFIDDRNIDGDTCPKEYGELIEGRFGACQRCHLCHVGLWSCNIKLNNNFDILVLNKILEDIDSSILPHLHDDKKSLLSRIASSKYLDDIVIYNPRFSILNEDITSHQPKRRSEGVVMGCITKYNGCDGEGQGKLVIKLPNYTSYGRHPDNWHGRPMKNSTFLAGLICWRACWPFLTEISRRCPPTHCQILFYYGAFKSYIGQHRDNSNVQYIKNVVRGKQQTRIGHSSGGVENSQILGSNVLVLTIGNKPMCFKFKYPTIGNLTAARSTYETSAKHQFTCGNMTISVLDPIDDLMMTHEVEFLFNRSEDVNLWYRIGYCFRWLTSFKEFYVDSCTMRLDSNAMLGKKCNKTSNRNIFT